MSGVQETSRKSLILPSWAISLIVVCTVLGIFGLGAVLVLSINENIAVEDGQDTNELEFDDTDSLNGESEDVAGIQDSTEGKESTFPDDTSDELTNSEQSTDDRSDDGSVAQTSIPVIPKPPSPIVVLDPFVFEFQSGFLPIHQRELLEHGDEEFTFTPTSLKDDSIRLTQQYVTYIPPSNTYLNKTVMGFVPYWTLSRYPEFQMEHLSVIAYFSVAVYPDGNFVTTCNGGYCGDKSGWDGWNSTELAAMVTLAHENGVKVVLTIKNFDKPSIENLVQSPMAQSTLISNIISEITAKNIDGVNIDYEYIGTASPELRAAFAASMDAIADAVHAARPGSHVSTDILGSSAISSLIYDVTALGQTSLDAIMVMSYDFHSTRYYDGKIAAPTSPLYGDQYWYTVSEAMRDIVARAPAGKVIMGVPYYGLEFPVSGATWGSKNASVVSSGAITTYANVVDPVFDAWHNNSSVQWDDGEKMTWYRYRWPNALSGPDYWQGYYDDARSLRAKYEFVLQNGIGGIGIWALGYDEGRVELWNVLRDVFSREPIIVLFREGISEPYQQSINQALSADVVRTLANGRGVIVRPNVVTSLQLIGQYNARPEVQRAGFLPYRSLRNIDDTEISF